MDYPRARAKAFKLQTIQTSFAATSIIFFKPERVLSKLNISLYTPTLLGSRLSSRSSKFRLKTPKTVIQVQKQATLLKNLLK